MDRLTKNIRWTLRSMYKARRSPGHPKLRPHPIAIAHASVENGEIPKKSLETQKVSVPTLDSTSTNAAYATSQSEVDSETAPSSLSQLEAEDQRTHSPPADNVQSSPSEADDVVAMDGDEPMGIEDAEELRRQAYVTFDVEEDKDYTAGPARMVVATDGVFDCVALLMTMALSAAVKSSVTAQRAYTKVEAEVEAETKTLKQLERKIRHELCNHNLRIGLLVEDEGAGQKEALKKEVETLNLMKEDTEAKRRILAFQVEEKVRYLRERQTALNALLEEAFIEANLMETQTKEFFQSPKEVNPQAEYQKFCVELRQFQGYGEYEEAEVAPLDDTEYKYEAPPLSAEQQAQRDLQDMYWEAQQRFATAQYNFDDREQQRWDELQMNCDAADRGEDTRDDSPEDFDLRWVQKTHDLTHELAEAEEAFTAAKQACVDAGVDICDDDRMSGFVDDTADGYRLSFEQEQIASVPSPKIRTWLSSVDELVSPGFDDPTKQQPDD
ncbi:uncharacterized protein LTR77_008845 [Saxophila tyrrhenica]|uniref:Uncharacterized protein n=1 Tax=Saxophila tyrrhenica TaxID=1690608 RepID=A0AAV9P0V0_9PEZI|nr:hypothetical protein LTR77_008845 [Saxophila tyrrhenica]